METKPATCSRMTPANAGVDAYYSWKCPKPLKNQDVVDTEVPGMSWMKSYVIIPTSSVKPPVVWTREADQGCRWMRWLRASVNSEAALFITVLPVYYHSLSLGSLPKWVVNKSSQYLAPKMLKKMHKACLKYPSWKQEHNANLKPWLHPEQNQLPTIALAELTLQHSSSLENIDESCVLEAREDRGDTSQSEN
uniref:Uncharacterized protein n=1 Tax=Sphaerodactylus townsendi TaxID=933632 RepID=A0ACB8FXP0_9SAUR